MLARHSRGFTLLELLVVIAIIGILMAMLLPAIQREAPDLDLEMFRLERAHFPRFEFSCLCVFVVQPASTARRRMGMNHQGTRARRISSMDDALDPILDERVRDGSGGCTGRSGFTKNESFARCNLNPVLGNFLRFA